MDCHGIQRPFISCFIALYAIRTLTSSKLPLWALFPISLIFRPLYDTFSSLVKRKLEDRYIASIGAVRTPELDGKSIANLDVLQQLMHVKEHGYPCEYLDDWLTAYGMTYNIRVLWEDQIFTVDPENVKALLATDFDNFEKGTKFRYAMDSVLGSGVFNSDGEMWKFHRSMTRPFFNRERTSDFHIFVRHTEESLIKMKSRLREGISVDFQDLIARFTMDSATEFLFGSCVHSLSSDLPYPFNVPPPPGPRTQSESDKFISAFVEAQHIISKRAWVGTIWPLFEIFVDKSREPMKIIDSFIDPILQQSLEKKSTTGSDEALTLLDHLVQFTTDKKVIKDEIMNIMIAGRDTTAETLTFAIYFLAMHPEVFTHLRQEVLSKLGDHTIPTYDDLRELKYLRAVINETLRLMPVVPFNVRQTKKGVLLPSTDAQGRHHYVPPRVNVSYSVFAMHRREELWGPDALQFDPNRFLDDRVRKYLTPNPFIFLPFNAGPRICLGQQFAYNEMSFFLARLAQSFQSISLDLEALAPDSRPPAYWTQCGGRMAIEKTWPMAYLTLFAKGGLWVRMEEADTTAEKVPI